jgi:hypothetical protein
MGWGAGVDWGAGVGEGNALFVGRLCGAGLLGFHALVLPSICIGIVVVTPGNHDAKRAALDLALDLDLRRPVKPRWPDFDSDLGGKPAGMPV